MGLTDLSEIKERAKTQKGENINPPSSWWMDSHNTKLGDKTMKFLFVKSLCEEIIWLILCADRK